MSAPSKRSYRSGLRARQAEATRQAILDAAARVTGLAGGPNATIAAIATEAGVSKETIHAIFGTKAALIGEMVIAKVGQSTPGRHFLDDERPRAIRAEPDPARQIALWSGYLTEILGRVAPLVAMVRAGAEAELEMGEVYRSLHRGRRENLSRVAQAICDTGGLRDGLSVEAVTDILWQQASPEMFGLMTGVGGCAPDEFARRLAATLTALLLREAAPHRRG